VETQGTLPLEGGVAKMAIDKDAIYERSRKNHLMAVGLLAALKENLPPQQAYKVAKDGFSHYMINYYKTILGFTKEGSQERFDAFKKHYEQLAQESEYLEVLESTPAILKVRFNRCPFSEVMDDYNLTDMTTAFCMSDLSFTQELLKGVQFSRTQVIAEGDKFCDPTWTFQKSQPE
jgi:hypothetical protein